MTKAKRSVSPLQREQKFLPNTVNGKGLSVSKIAKIQGVITFDLNLTEGLWEKEKKINLGSNEKIKVLLCGDEHLQRQTEQFTGLSCHGSKHIVRQFECHVQTKRRLIRNIRDVVRHISLHKEMAVIVVYRHKKKFHENISFCDVKSTWPPVK